MLMLSLRCIILTCDGCFMANIVLYLKSKVERHRVVSIMHVGLTIYDGTCSSSLRSNFITTLTLALLLLDRPVIVSAYRYIAITNLPIIPVFVEYLGQLLIDFSQIYRHSSVPKNTSP